MLNLDEISESAAELNLLPISKTGGRHFGILFPVFIFA